jgi:hypothetical protein
MAFEMFEEDLPVMFVAHAADVLADTHAGLTGARIARLMRGFAARYGREIPHGIYPFAALNRRTALHENRVSSGWRS